MSLPVQVPLQSVVAVAGQTVFPFNFRCDDGTTIQVYLNDVLQGGATVALNADQTASPGGTVTLVAGAALNDVVSMERVTPPAQTMALTPFGAFGAVAFIAVLDKIVELVQEVLAKVNRSLRISRTAASKVANLDLPSPALGGLIGWGDAGGGLLKLVNLNGMVSGEALADSGDHIHFTSAHAPIGNGSLYRNGQRIFVANGDYTVAGNVWTLTTPLNPAAGETLNVDYTY